MGAVYGIHGEADLGEVRRMGARLAHRGQQQAVWSVTPRVHLGTRACLGAAAQPSGLPIAFAGFFDYRPELLELVGAEGDRAAAERVTDAELFLAVYRRHGLDGLGLIRGQFAAALWDAAWQRLLLVCDPLATQLLYVAQAGGRYAFATEYKALWPSTTSRPGPTATRSSTCSAPSSRSPTARCC